MSNRLVFGTPEANTLAALEPELLDCPFCGGQPTFVGPDLPYPQLSNKWLIYCGDCQTYPEDGTREEVIKHWNTRLGAR